MSKSAISILFIGFLAFLGLNSLFTMNERQQGLVLQFGEPKRVVSIFRSPFQNALNSKRSKV